jgi:pyridoxal phosphate enzyme (YggS family)
MDLKVDLTSRLDRIISQMTAASHAAGRDPSATKLLAVTKYQSEEKIRILFDLGVRDFGENYVNELERKAANLQDLPINWHFIGRLQSNKIGKLVKICSVIHSVGSLRHAQAIDKAATVAGKKVKVFIQVNAGSEESKDGCSFEEVPGLASEFGNLGHIQLLGVMAIPPSEYSDQIFLKDRHIPELYQRLANLAKAVGDKELSVGMSGDMALAIAAGATWVRIGQALLGSRIKS